MNLSEHFEQLLSYDVWGNREVIASLKSLSSPPADGTRWVAHIIAAEYVWLTRLNHEAQPLAVWPELTLAQCEQHVQALGDGWAKYFAQHLPGDLDATVSYKNSKGEAWSSKVRDILTHVFFHSAYHRGQIASAMRRAGHTPAYTDFIHGVRQGLVTEGKAHG